MTDIVVTEALGESLSPSQVSTNMTCPAKWYFRYLIGLSEPTTGATALGKAFSRPGHEMEARELREVFCQEWSSVIADAGWRDDEDADELAATGQVLVTAYLTEAAAAPPNPSGRITAVA